MSILEPVALSRDCLARALRGAGINVVGEHADERLFLAALGDDRPQVALVDVSLAPEGLSAIREARQFHAAVRFLALGMGGGSEVVDRAMEAGAVGYVDQRSAGAQSLVEAIAAVVRGERVVPSDFLSSLFQPREDRGRQSALRDLSAREREVLSCIAGGADNLQIARHLRISERTVKAHVSSLYRKLAQKNRTQLALLARQIGVRPPEEMQAGELSPRTPTEPPAG